MKSLMLIIKGFIMGIANIIPGVSGGTLALTLGIYEDFINALSHFFSDLKLQREAITQKLLVDVYFEEK